MILKNANLVSPDKIIKADVLFVGEKIKAVGQDLAFSGEEVLDCSDKFVLPGLIDVHVHFRDPGAVHKEDFLSGSRAALSGGVTTVLDMPNNNPSISTMEALGEKIECAKKSVCDYSLYFGATNDESLAKLAGERREVAALKIYMGSSTGSLLVSEERKILRNLEEFSKKKPVVVHAEFEELIQKNALEFTEDNVAMHNKIRSESVALTAVQSAVKLAKKACRRLHVAHASTIEELREVDKAKQDAYPTTCEVTPHHLLLNEESLEKLGNFGRMNPPLRSKKQQQALVKNFALIDCIATDHAPHSREEKNQAYSKAPSGVPGVETMLPLLLTLASEKKITLEQIVEKTSLNPSKIFGLKNKGELKQGFDADLVVVDLEKHGVIEDQKLFTKCGWSPFNGWNTVGAVEKTFLRGTLVFENGKVLAQSGFGKLVELSQ